MTGTRGRLLVFLLCGAVGASGCVNKENYTREVNRANNFQRLLSEEEKRGVELSAEIAKLKDQVAGLEAKNKTLTAQLNDAKAQVVRSLEEVGRLQDEVKQGRAMGSLSPIEPPDRLDELQPASSAKKKGRAAAPSQKAAAKPAPVQPVSPPPAPPPPPPAQTQPKAPAPAQTTAAGDAFFRYHEVRKGETLKDIAKRYKTDVNTLRELNDLAVGDAVRPGDRIIVGQKP